MNGHADPVRFDYRLAKNRDVIAGLFDDCVEFPTGKFAGQVGNLNPVIGGAGGRRINAQRRHPPPPIKRGFVKPNRLNFLEEGDTGFPGKQSTSIHQAAIASSITFGSSGATGVSDEQRQRHQQRGVHDAVQLDGAPPSTHTMSDWGGTGVTTWALVGAQDASAQLSASVL